MDLPSRSSPVGGAVTGWLAPAAAAQLASAGIAARQGLAQSTPLPRRPWPARICSRQRSDGRCTACCHQHGGLQISQHDSGRQQWRQRLQVVIQAADACPLRSHPQQQMQTASSVAAAGRDAHASADSKWQAPRLDHFRWPGVYDKPRQPCCQGCILCPPSGTAVDKTQVHNDLTCDALRLQGGRSASCGARRQRWWQPLLLAPRCRPLRPSPLGTSRGTCKLHSLEFDWGLAASDWLIQSIQLDLPLHNLDV